MFKKLGFTKTAYSSKFLFRASEIASKKGDDAWILNRKIRKNLSPVTPEGFARKQKLMGKHFNTATKRWEQAEKFEEGAQKASIDKIFSE